MIVILVMKMTLKQQLMCRHRLININCTVINILFISYSPFFFIVPFAIQPMANIDTPIPMKHKVIAPLYINMSLIPRFKCTGALLA